MCTVMGPIIDKNGIRPADIDDYVQMAATLVGDGEQATLDNLAAGLELMAEVIHRKWITNPEELAMVLNVIKEARKRLKERYNVGR